MRLNWYVPFRKSRGPRAWILRIAPSWIYSPLRRLTQAAAAGVFLWLFFFVCRPDVTRSAPPGPRIEPSLPVETFLSLDPLVGFVASLAARSWTPALLWGLGILTAGLFIPRLFCGYLCPLGTLIDLSDGLLGRWFRRKRRPHRGWWAGARYWFFLAAIVAALLGTPAGSYLAPIPALTRSLEAVASRLGLGRPDGWQVPAWSAGQIAAVALVAAILLMTLLGPRFWCRCLCPSGAMLSLGAMLRLTDRQVTGACNECGKCAAVCPFDAIRSEFTTRGTDCTFCQTCGGACPTGAIRFTSRWTQVPRPPVTAEVPRARQTRRAAMLSALMGGTGLGALTAFGMRQTVRNLTKSEGGSRPLRPPGSVPEDAFMARCARCGQCVKACPTGVLRPLSLDYRLGNLWTPHAEFDRAGCDPRCNNCGQVCPTGAIRGLVLEEKNAARMGRAEIDERTCLPHAGREACRYCADACRHAGYDAIEFLRVHVELDEQTGEPVEDSGFLAPVLRPERCVGCGLCQSRCHAIHVEDGRLAKAAIVVRGGEGREDRLLSGSYLSLQRQRQRQAASTQPGPDSTDGTPAKGEDYLPGFLK